MIIVTKNKAYTWDYKRFGRNLFYVAAAICFIWAFAYLSNLDYLDAIR